MDGLLKQLQVTKHHKQWIMLMETMSSSGQYWLTNDDDDDSVKYKFNDLLTYLCLLSDCQPLSLAIFTVKSLAERLNVAQHHDQRKTLRKNYI